MHITDLSTLTYNNDLHDGANVRSVSWLGNRVRIRSTGDLPADLRERLRDLVERYAYSDHWLGAHTCEICDGADGHGELAIEHDGVRYVAPSLILHYVEAHQYLPPAVFQTALREGVPLDRGGGGYSRDALPAPVVTGCVPVLVRLGPAGDREYPFVDAVTIGRGPECAVQVEGPATDDIQCRLWRGPRQFQISEGSARGTLVNGEWITERTLFGGEHIDIGDVAFRFRLRDPEIA